MRYEEGDNTPNDGFITGPAAPINIINKYISNQYIMDMWSTK